jgi:hypothetical protein
MTMVKSDRTAYAKVVARAWSDPVFKAQLLADPNAALAAMGAPVPPGVGIKVVENTDKLVHLVLLAPPADTELSQEALEQVAAGQFTLAAGASALFQAAVATSSQSAATLP